MIRYSFEWPHLHINAESKHLTLLTDPEDESASTDPIHIPTTRFAGISTAENHMSKTQFNRWMSFFKNALGIYNDSPLGQRAIFIFNLVEVAQKILGVSTDYGKDQKKPFDLIREWKKILDREQQGERVLKEALYAQAISHPYMRQFRGPEQEHQNILDLEPLHMKVKAHCQRMPDLLLAADASYELGLMDGKLWQRPEAVYAVQSKTSTLPYIRGTLVAFFEGALTTWKRFTSEFAKERQKAFMKTTNDDNEGVLGAYRVAMRKAP